ncbi:hypothetical protein QMM44_15335 [Leptospira santarosai]|uniref:hypothetical protein n=1 Tax=Leptospira santarosai TaxID=28183 RepID=UPI0003089999|nr:hypothetical protein [Leptospira santarosai]MDI7204799.1 hypothetical protein [Leptospira santarosai]MDI7222870.1 hypothetical protein [Leptospira santarosai]
MMNFSIPDKSDFGKVSEYDSFRDVLRYLQNVFGKEKKAAIAYAMLLSVHLTKRGPYRDDSLKALDLLSKAKTRLDIACAHTRPAIDITSEILNEAQRFADEASIPCTEWPTVEEIIEIVSRSARKFVTSSDQ